MKFTGKCTCESLLFVKIYYFTVRVIDRKWRNCTSIFHEFSRKITSCVFSLQHSAVQHSHTSHTLRRMPFPLANRWHQNVTFKALKDLFKIINICIMPLGRNFGGGYRSQRQEINNNWSLQSLSNLEQSSVLIGAGIWYQMNPVLNLRDTRTRNRCQKTESIYGASFWV